MKKQLLFTTMLLLTSILSFGQWKLNAFGTNDIRLRTGGYDRLTILPNGNVGIGTNLPDSKLHVFNGFGAGAVTAFSSSVATLESSSSAYLSILTPAIFEGGIIFGSPINNHNGYLSYSHPLNTMYLGTNGLPRMAIDGTGNVGIGTTTPQAKLDVNGDFRLSKNLPLPCYCQSVTYNDLDRHGASIIYLSANYTTINGIAGGVEGMIVYLVGNTVTLGDIILNNNSGAAPLNDKILTNTGSSITVTGNVTLLYVSNGFVNAWRVIGVTVDH